MLGQDVIQDRIIPDDALHWYIYLTILVMIVRFMYVIKPLLHIYRKYSGNGIIGILREVKKEVKLTGIEGYIVAESILMIIPISLAVIVRLSFGQALTIDELNVLQIGVACSVALCWIYLSIRDSWNTSKSLKVLGAPSRGWGWLKVLHRLPSQTDVRKEMFLDPKVMKGIWWSRNRLVAISAIDELELLPKFDDEVDSAEPVILRTEEGRIDGVDTQALTQNLRNSVSGFAVESARKGKNMYSELVNRTKAKSGEIVQSIDEILQENVDKYTNPTLRSRIISLSYNLLMNVGPLLLIYMGLPVLV